MCPPKAPKAPPPKDTEEKPLRYLLSRDQYDKLGNTQGSGGNYFLPRRGRGSSPGGGGRMFDSQNGGPGLAPAIQRQSAPQLGSR